MANASDVVRALRAMHQGDATSIARAPTGIEPGFDATTGITWTEDGRARYRTTPSGAGAKLLSMHYKNSSQSISTSGTPVVNFDQEQYDPDGLVTTGASWAFTVPADGWHLIAPKIRFEEIASGWSAGDTASLMLKINGSPFEYLDILDDPQNNTLNNILEASVPFDLNAGDTIAIGMQLSTSGSKTIDGSFQCRCAIYFLNS